MPESESIFMTYHLVNAKSDVAQVQETIQITNLINGIIDYHSAAVFNAAGYEFF